MQKPDIQRLLEFQRLLLQFETVERRVHIPPHYQLENDTEHSYNLAMTAWYLSKYFPELDSDRVIRLALVHDLVEIYAGDTYFFADSSTLATKASREAAALERLAKEWPDFPDLIATIRHYEEKNTSEAAFVYALDKIMPVMLIYLGEGYSWQQAGITREQLHKAKLPKVAASKAIEAYYSELYQLLSDHSHYFTQT